MQHHRFAELGLFYQPRLGGGRIGPEAKAGFGTPLPHAAQNLRAGANLAVDPFHRSIKHAEEMLKPLTFHQRNTCEHEPCRCGWTRTLAQAKTGALPDKRALNGSTAGEMQEMFVGHATASGGQEAHRSAMKPVGALPDHIEGVERVILIALLACVIDLNLPAKPLGKLFGAVTKHALRQAAVVCQAVAVEKSDHG